ncbi:hypothetical protein SSJG_03625 [Escherichia coli D9]|nr:hypothetical protein SSJG_03625 [Escherichia coli D9]
MRAVFHEICKVVKIAFFTGTRLTNQRFLCC